MDQVLKQSTPNRPSTSDYACLEEPATVKLEVPLVVTRSPTTVFSTHPTLHNGPGFTTLRDVSIYQWNILSYFYRLLTRCYKCETVGIMPLALLG